MSDKWPFVLNVVMWILILCLVGVVILARWTPGERRATFEDPGGVLEEIARMRQAADREIATWERCQKASKSPYPTERRWGQECVDAMTQSLLERLRKEPAP